MDDFIRRCHLNNEEHAERYLMEMSREGKVVVRIDSERKIVFLDEVKVITLITPIWIISAYF